MDQMDQPNLPESIPPALPTSAMAVVSLIAGIVGILFFPFLGGIVAIVTGNMARKETRSFPPTHSGDGMATTGMVLGWLSLLLWIIVCCLIISGMTLAAFGGWFNTR
jgi:hypothetical protein